MSTSEEDTYSTVFSSLKHPIRRRILRTLSNKPESFSALQKYIRIESSHLTYHLEGLGSLLLKTEDGKYALSSLGEAAVSTMKHVEEPSENPTHSLLPPAHRTNLLKWLTFLLICGLVASLVFNGVLFFRYTDSDMAVNTLDKAYNAMDQAYTELNRTRNALNQAYTELNNTRNYLENAYDNLNETYQSLLGDAQSNRIYNVNTGLEYATIQDAINAAENGNTILVGSGTYYEHLTISKTLALISADRKTAVIDGSNVSTIVTITADSVLFDGFTVRGSGFYFEGAGIRLDHSNYSTVRGNIITLSGWAGIELDNSSNNVVSNNIVSSIGTKRDLAFGIGVYLGSSTNNTISGNVIVDSGSTATLLDNSSSNSITGNTFENNGDISGVLYSDSNMFFNNNFIHNTRIALSDNVSNNSWSYNGSGNYWDDYVGLDDGSNARTAGDGVGDTNLPWHGVDNYPLISPVNPVNVIWDTTAFPVSIVDNSTISAFTFNHAERRIAFDVVGPASTSGYLNLSIPIDLLSGPWTILLDGTDVTYQATITENQTSTAISLNYSHNTHSIQVTGTNVIPEYAMTNTFLVLPLLALAPTILIAKKKRTNANQTRNYR